MGCFYRVVAFWLNFLMSKNFVLKSYLKIGYALGAGTALIGKEAAMACTVAVEDTIIDHYNSQIRTLLKADPKLHEEMISLISQFRDEEQEHHDIGLAEDAEQAPAYQLLTSMIKLGCKSAIFISEKI